MSLGIAQQTLVVHALTHDNLQRGPDVTDLPILLRSEDANGSITTTEAKTSLNLAYANLGDSATADLAFVDNAKVILRFYGFSDDYVENLKDDQFLNLRSMITPVSTVDFGDQSETPYEPKSCREALQELVAHAVELG